MLLGLLSGKTGDCVRGLGTGGLPARQLLAWQFRANERLTLNRAGQVVLTLKIPYRDGTTHIVRSPLEFMQRLAALEANTRVDRSI